MSAPAVGGRGGAVGSPGLFQPFIGAILRSMPDEWRGTTFNNSALLGREAFTERLLALLSSKASAGTLALSALVPLIHSSPRRHTRCTSPPTIRVSLPRSAHSAAVRFAGYRPFIVPFSVLFIHVGGAATCRLFCNSMTRGLASQCAAESCCTADPSRMP